MKTLFSWLKGQKNNKNMMLILLILILIVTIILGVLVFKRVKDDKKKPDYKTLYIIGISWFPLGIIFMASGFSVGIVLSVMGFG